jgi:hypothetical protein
MRAWRAKWIAPSGRKSDNFTFLSRRHFKILKVAKHAILRVAADSRYAIYLNGEFVGNGPVRGTHRRYFFDEYDIAARLRPGANWISAEVHCPGRSTFTMVPHAPGFLAEIPGIVWTDRRWQVRVDPSRRTDAALYTMQIGFSEWRDLRAEPPGWHTGGDGAEGWRAAKEVGVPGVYGGRALSPRGIALLTADSTRPSGILKCGWVPKGVGEGNEYAALMHAESHLRARPGAFRNLDALIRPAGEVTLFPPPDGKGSFLILDFGGERFGNLSLDVEAPAGTILDVGYDEAVQKSRLASLRCASYCFADRFVLREGRQTITQRLHRRGFRYLQLVCRNFNRPVRIRSARVIQTIYSREPTADFSCPDPFLNRLWKACVNTVRLCCSDTFMDCIWREQAFWLNDQAVTNRYYLLLTGDPVFAAHNLRMGADGVTPDGMIPFVYPSDNRLQNSGMPALWAITLWEYGLYSGDLRLLKELCPILEKSLALYDRWRGPDGLVGDRPGMWNFADWGYVTAGVTIQGKTAVMNMLIAAGFRDAALVEAAVGNQRRADEYLRKSREVVRALNARLWSSRKGCYRDCTEPKGKPTCSQHPLALGLAFDLFEPPQRGMALAHLMDPELIRPELCFQLYVLESLARSGRSAEALKVIRQFWGPMIHEGADTIWEAAKGRSSFGNQGSLCHAFACAPADFMISVILGVKPLKPGFAEFSFAPNAVGLPSASGTVPTPHGPITVEWKRKGRGVKAKIKVPEGTVAITSDGNRLGSGSHRVHA